VFVPLLILHLILVCSIFLVIGLTCYNSGCLYIPPSWFGLFVLLSFFGLSCFESMSELSPRSPLSISSTSNGSSDNMQDHDSSVDFIAQPPNPPFLDGVRSNHHAQPSESPRPTFTDGLKFGLGSHGGCLNPTFEPKLSTQP